MIRPEVITLFRRWAEPVIALGGTLIALWIVGAPYLRWGWVSLVLGGIILVSGGLWTREAFRRARFSSGDASGGRVFVEEKRIFYVGRVGNVQVELRDITRIDLAVSKPNGKSWTSLLLSTEAGPPAAIPLNAEGQDAFIDALCGLPGFRFDDLAAAIQKQQASRGFAPIVTFWRRDQ